MRLKWSYFRSFWSCIDLGIIGCSWGGFGIYFWRYREANRISSRFKETNGYVFINLQLANYINDVLLYLLGYCCFFATLKFLRLCRFHRRLSLFSDTIRHASKELVMFSMMFAVVFMAFLTLFYLLFLGTISSCATLLHTAQMLFEMMLMKFDAHELQGAAAFLGPFCFTIFVLVVVFVCMSMFVTIINDSFRFVRDRARNNPSEDQLVMVYMLHQLQRWLGIREKESVEQRRTDERAEYLDPIEGFPKKIDQLLKALDRVRSLTDFSFE